ncbi:MAG: DUF4230 domain-containing protein [Bacteroidota bacterium]
MLTLITMLFSKKNIGPTLLVIGLVVAGIIFLPRMLGKKTPSFKPIHPSSLLKRIEHMEHLRLSTYFFEEVITIGTKKRVKKLVDRKREEVAKAEKVLQIRTGFLVKKDLVLQSHKKHLNESDTVLIRLQQELAKARKSYKEMDQFVFEFTYIKNQLEADSNYYGPEVKDAFVIFVKEQKLVGEKPWKAKEDSIRAKNRAGRAGLGKGRLSRKQKDWLQSYKDRVQLAFTKAENSFKNTIQVEKNARLNTVNRKFDLVQAHESQNKTRQDSIKALVKVAQNEYNDASKYYDEAEKDLENKKKKLAGAEKELEQALLSGQDSIQPQLLIIVPTEVSSYIDLRELRIGERILGDTLQILIPEVKLDSVIVDLDSTAESFDLGGRKITFSGSGVYYEVYEQLRDGIKETEISVKKKAIQAGIYEETRKLAYRYIKDFASTLGYNVQIVDSLGQMVPPEPIFDPELEAQNLLLEQTDLGGHKAADPSAGDEATQPSSATDSASPTPGN